MKDGEAVVVGEDDGDDRTGCCWSECSALLDLKTKILQNVLIVKEGLLG